MFTHEALWQGIDRVAERQGWTLSRLATIAGLDATALNRSKRFGTDAKPRWPSMSTIAKLLAATNMPLSEFCRLVETGEEPAAPTRRGHVLLVDDDQLFREASAEQLRAAGYIVHQAPGHRDALDLLEDGRPVDLLCTDIVMPEGMGGLALARLARARRPGLKILYITGYEIAARHEFRGLVLRKPVRPQDLLSEVERMIALRPNSR
jgi:two-component system cell cycle response regulator CpdR